MISQKFKLSRSNSLKFVVLVVYHYSGSLVDSRLASIFNISRKFLG